MRRLGAVVVAAVVVTLVPVAVASPPGKRIAHNRGTWTGEPIEVVGGAPHPRSMAVRVRWRTLEQPDAVGAAAIPGAGVTVKWMLICQTGSGGAVRRKGSFTATASPDVETLAVPRSGLARCQLLADASGPSGVIGKILLDLYARS